MSALSTDKKPLVDYGVQIRFINDLHDTGGGIPEKSRAAAAAATPPSNKYGVAVRVQGISGQPYLVLKDGEKGDSYGVQLKAQAMPQSPSLSPGPGSRYNSLGRDPKPPGFPKPYVPVGNTRSSSVSPAEEVEGEVFGSPLKRPPGDGQAVGQVGDGERGGAPKADPLPKTVTNGGAGKRPEWDSGDEFNEAGLKRVNRNGVGARSVKQNGFTSAGSLGRHSGKAFMQNFPLESFPEGPPPPPSSSSSSSAPAEEEEEEEERAPAIDTESLAPINKLISKFNSSGPGGSTQPRGRAGARQRLRLDERKRSRSLDARKEAEVALPLAASPAFTAVNPYASTPAPRLTPSKKTLASPGSASVGPETSAASVATAMALPTSSPGFKSSRSSVAKDTPHPAIPKKPETPAPLRHQSRSLDVSSDEDEQAKQAIYNILKDGSSASEASIKRKVNLIYAKTNPLKFRGSMGNPNKDCHEHLNEAKELREQLNRLKAELREAHDELAEGRMAREASESTMRQQEDQLAELQEELRRISEGSPYSDSLQTDVATLQAEVVEAAMLRQRQEETLHQRERELTALKGALKEEVESHDEEVENLREQYSQDMEVLRRTMEEFSQSQEDIEGERQRVNASMVSLGDELDSCRNQGDTWKTQLEATQRELQRCRLGREELEVELRELQDSVSSTKNQKPGVDDDRFEAAQRCHDDLKRTRAELDKQKAEFEQKCTELQALRKAGEETEAGLRSEISRLKDQSQSDKAELEKAKESLAGSSVRPTLEQESAQELQEANARLRERLSRMTRHSSTLPLSPGAEEAVEALEDDNRALKTQLEEARRGAARLGKEKEELGRRLEERDQEREALRRGKIELEEQKRLLDRALDKINKEMESMMGDSRQSVMGLQTQLEEYRDRSRKELLEAQRNGKDRLAELQRSQTTLKAQQDEISRLKKDLLAAGEERDGAQLERDLLNGRLKHMEEELEAEQSTHTDRSREIRSLEDKLKSVGIELDEEKSNVELLNDRIARSREQVEQLRSELMQERSARHDLEMDKSSMERQLKELKSRVADMETPSRPSAGIAVLEKKVQELEETLLSEEREKVTIMASQRRMERRLKDLNATLDQERNQSAEQKDQLSLRVKALKRQVDESECEVERLEGVRRKGLRELEEQQEQREALQAKVTALEAELKRKVQHSRTLALSSVHLSSEDEDILSEIHLQNNN